MFLAQFFPRLSISRHPILPNFYLVSPLNLIWFYLISTSLDLMMFLAHFPEAFIFQTPDFTWFYLVLSNFTRFYLIFNTSITWWCFWPIFQRLSFSRQHQQCRKIYMGGAGPLPCCGCLHFLLQYCGSLLYHNIVPLLLKYCVSLLYCNIDPFLLQYCFRRLYRNSVTPIWTAESVQIPLLIWIISNKILMIFHAKIIY